MVACSINLPFLLLTSTILLTLHSNVYFHHSNLLLISLVIALIYRPPSSSLPLFLQEFSLLTETLYMHSSLFILGDFISPHNNKLNAYSLKLDNLFNLFNLTQHANLTTHCRESYFIFSFIFLLRHFSYSQGSLSWIPQFLAMLSALAHFFVFQVGKRYSCSRLVEDFTAMSFSSSAISQIHW